MQNEPACVNGIIEIEQATEMDVAQGLEVARKKATVTPHQLGTTNVVWAKMNNCEQAVTFRQG
ncbi:hypothetical protein EHF33_20125 (plasmid) [Deinococcus psychrotolerans]|uniref:Uncharacterized protein n=1 Tax=Deinococcus psychrotolerans TaxID=2489213 RepID=A0A3G8YIX3_9DEIO|nr:hypothetical protein [Deinococcus psychrotolerans]AZI45219.1 hypothetical protein EHF33_20125 [Deinococcus psychrotolerans]